MKYRLLELLACPRCGGGFRAQPSISPAQPLVEGELVCERCARTVPVTNGIPRFVPTTNYADNFSLQWQKFARTQLDSHSETDISKQRFEASTGWNRSMMTGKRVLDVGCGAGRFAEIAAESGAHVIVLDFSSAIDVADRNLSHRDNVDSVQASAVELPFTPSSFDFIYCLGVLQHTPDPEQTFRSLVPHVKPGGAIAVDVYPRLWRNLLWSKYWLRPITKRIPDHLLFGLVVRTTPVLLRMSRFVARIPRIGGLLRYLVPVANYDGVYALTPGQLKEWAILDTFDMLAPAHDHAQSEVALRRWFKRADLEGVEVFRRGHLIGRARRVSASGPSGPL